MADTSPYSFVFSHKLTAAFARDYLITEVRDKSGCLIEILRHQLESLFNRSSASPLLLFNISLIKTIIEQFNFVEKCIQVEGGYIKIRKKKTNSTVFEREK